MKLMMINRLLNQYELLCLKLKNKKSFTYIH